MTLMSSTLCFMGSWSPPLRPLGFAAPFWHSSRVVSWALVFPKHGLPQTGQFCKALYFLLKQSRISKCDATKHDLSLP